MKIISLKTAINLKSITVSCNERMWITSSTARSYRTITAYSWLRRPTVTR